MNDKTAEFIIKVLGFTLVVVTIPFCIMVIGGVYLGLFCIIRMVFG